MRELLSKIKKRRVWGIGAFVLFMLLFLSFFALKEGGIINAAPGDPGEPLTGIIFQDEESNRVASGGRLTMRRAEEEFLIRMGQPKYECNNSRSCDSTQPSGKVDCPDNVWKCCCQC